ncbi:MAG: Rieske 2Fe-2S domain-containing protein [Panacagrimonas sp.]
MAMVRACSLDDLWEGEMREVSIGGRRVLLVHADGGHLAAFSALCPHQAFPLVNGSLEGNVLTCSAHLWQFDATTGLGVNPKGCALRRYAVMQDNGEVFVDLAATAPATP